MPGSTFRETEKTTLYENRLIQSHKKKEQLIIGKIAKRAHALHRDYRVMTAIMDVTAYHANGCPLDLQRLLDADYVNFAHDISGIARHINRNTGHLEDCFVPRCAVKDIDFQPVVDFHQRECGGGEK